MMLRAVSHDQTREAHLTTKPLIALMLAAVSLSPLPLRRQRGRSEAMSTHFAAHEIMTRGGFWLSIWNLSSVRAESPCAWQTS